MEKTLADLKKIKDRIKEINEDIKPQLAMINGLQEAYDEVLNEIIDNVEFKPDRFMEAKGLKGDSYREGGLKIIRHIRMDRKLNQTKFKKLYPKEFQKYGEIGLTKADKAIGQDRTNELCVISEKERFEFYDPSDVREE